MATTPMFSPDGVLGDIPNAKIQDAVKAGFKLGVDLTAPNGQKGTVPMDKVHDAIKAGFSPFVPNESQALANPPIAPLAEGALRSMAVNAEIHAPMPGSFEGHPENIGEYVPATIGNIAKGAGDIARGNFSRGAHEVISGAGNAAMPMAPLAVAAAPLASAGAVAGSMVGSHVARKGAEKLGATEDQQDLAGDIGGLAGGYAGSKITKLSDVASSIAKSPRNGIKQLTGRSIEPERLNVAPASGQLQPALQNTPQEVVQYAADKGIDLTPAEASGKPIAKTIQAVGERSILKGDQLAEARQANALKLAKNVRSFADQVDPKGMGLTEEGAGESIQHTARVARSVAHENATAAYSQAGIDQADLAGDLGPLNNLVQDETMVRQPHAAVARPEYKSPEVKAALDDIASKPQQLGPRPSIQSMRNLRTEFLERSRTAPGEAQTAAQRLYSKAADITDQQMMKAAKGTPFEESFRDASEQWAALKQKFDDPGTVLNRILSQRDPATVTRSILNRASANDIAVMRKENMQPALDALKRQVIQDVANRGFRVNGDGLGGYSHSFITQLFGPEGTKELYLNGELARRMGFQMNPSGTSNVLLGMDQLTLDPRKWLPSGTAAAASMPRPAQSYLPKPITGVRQLLNRP